MTGSEVGLHLRSPKPKSLSYPRSLTWGRWLKVAEEKVEKVEECLAKEIDKREAAMAEAKVRTMEEFCKSVEFEAEVMESSF